MINMIQRKINLILSSTSIITSSFLFYQEQLVGGKINDTSLTFPDPTNSLEVVSTEVAERGVERKSRSKGPRAALSSRPFCENGNVQYTLSNMVAPSHMWLVLLRR